MDTEKWVSTGDKELWSMLNPTEEKSKDKEKNEEDQSRLDFKVGGSCSNVFPPSLTQRNSSPSDSFVVINGSPVEEVEAFAIANSREVQEKALSVDFNSMISNINPDEINKKLLDVLQENKKLKETLIRNNDTMEKNFNSLITWQERVDSILNHHKIKFSEIRDLVYQLKKENGELKMKIASNIDKSTIHDVNRILDSSHSFLNETENDIQNKKIESSTQLSDSLCEEFEHSFIKSEVKISNKSVNTSTDSAKLISSEVNASTENSSKNDKSNICPELCMSNLTNCTSFRSVSSDVPLMQRSNSVVKSSTSSQSNELIKLTQNSTSLDENRKQTLSGEKMCKEIEEQILDLRNDFHKLELGELKDSVDSRKSRLVANVNQYSDQLQKMVDYYTKERARCRGVQESLIKAEKMISKIDLTSDKMENARKIQELQYQIEKLHSQFLQDIVKYSEFNKNLIKEQKLFQKIFWDYCETVNELDVLEEENFKMKALEDNVNEKNKVLENLTKQYVEKMRVLSLRDKEFEEKEAHLRSNQAMLQEQLKEVAVKSKQLDDKIAKLDEEMEKLKEEKNSYDKQMVAELMGNTTVQKEMKEQHELELRNMQLVINDLRTQLDKMQTEKESVLLATQLQLSTYKDDFELERKSKEKLIEEREVLRETIRNFQREKANVTEAQSTVQQRNEYCYNCNRWMVPGERHGWNICNMEFD